MPHQIESEIIKVTGYKIRGKFADRQDYLKSLFEAAQKIDDDAFDDLTQESADWLNECVTAYNTRHDLPDFDEVVGSEDDDDTADDEEVDVEEGDRPEDDASDQDDDTVLASGQDADEDAPEQEDKNEAEQPPAKKSRKSSGKVDKPKRPVRETPPPVKHKLRDPVVVRNPEDAVLDKWGSIVGSKNSQALALFEQGATTREVKEKLGGTYYNILGKMAQRGHRVEKDAAIIKLTHKDDIKVSSRKPKK